MNKIYVWRSKTLNGGKLKIGETTRNDVRQRINESLGVTNNTPDFDDIEILFFEQVLKNNGEEVRDKEIHKILKNSGISSYAIDGKNSEFFDISFKEFEQAVYAVKRNLVRISRYSKDFKMRPEQEQAVSLTKNYFEKEGNVKFLWNAKMRFGKTFTAYKLMKRMKLRKVLILSFKVAVQGSWKNDLLEHWDFQEYDFLSKNDQNYNKIKKDKFVCFASFQDVSGKGNDGEYKDSNEFIFNTNWDMVILDEYHYGAWNSKSKNLYENNYSDIELIKLNKEEILKIENSISTKYKLFLSGTPYKALTSGEFLSEQIFNWTYIDEQRAKKNWNNKNGANPYYSLPKLSMYTYKLPNKILDNSSIKGDFDLNKFFKTKNCKFVNINAISNWLDFVSSKKDAEKYKEETGNIPPLPFVHFGIANKINHSIWYLNSVESCQALEKLLKEHIIFKTFEIINISGGKITNKIALYNVKNAIKNNKKTITITAGRLMTGVTIPQWGGIFMLNSCNSPETYFQSIFRVQSPWEKMDKQECFVFDFSPERTLKQVIEMVQNDNSEITKRTDQKLEELAEYLAINFFDGSNMALLSIEDIIEVGTSGASSKLLAQRWKSTLLVNLDNKTMTNILQNEKLKSSLYNIEGFRSLGDDIVDILVNSQNTIEEKSNEIKKAREEGRVNEIKILSEEERLVKKELQNVRKKIREKLLIFAARIPIFMYLTDHREEAVKDVIQSLDTKLFTRTTGLTLDDFNSLLDAGLFNKRLMNDSVYDFKKFEDNSFEYLGESTHSDDYIGLWDTKVKNK